MSDGSACEREGAEGLRRKVTGVVGLGRVVEGDDVVPYTHGDRPGQRETAGEAPGELPPEIVSKSEGAKDTAVAP